MIRDLSRSGFTLIELLVFAAIFLIVSISFVTILISVTQVYMRQSAASEVNQQSLFVLQTIQRFVEQSSLIEMTVGETTSTLKLRMPSSTEDPTYIYFEPVAQAIWLRQTDNPAAPTSSLTTKNVKVVDLVFTKRSNATAMAPSIGHSSVGVTFTLAYNSQNPKQNFTQSLAMSVARVNAATFDSDIVPVISQNDTLKVGATGSRWKSINDLIYFSGSNVGIANSNPNQTLDVSGGIQASGIIQTNGGGVRINTSAAPPTCNASAKGMLWLVQNATDSLQVCLNTDSGYNWVKMYYQ